MPNDNNSIASRFAQPGDPGIAARFAAQAGIADRFAVQPIQPIPRASHAGTDGPLRGDSSPASISVLRAANDSYPERVAADIVAAAGGFKQHPSPASLYGAVTAIPGAALGELTTPIENYTQAGRAEHPALARIGDFTSRLKQLGRIAIPEASLLFGGPKGAPEMALGETQQAAQQAASTAVPRPSALAEQAGLSYKGELTAGSRVHQFEHPNYPGLTLAQHENELTSPEALQASMGDKLNQFRQSDSELVKRILAKGDQQAVQPGEEVQLGEGVQPGQTVQVAPESFIRKVSSPESHVSSDVVNKYREQIRSGQPLEPLKLTLDEQGNVLDADGRHRALAAMQEGMKTIPVEVSRRSAAEAAQQVVDAMLPHDTPLETRQQVAQALPADAAARIAANSERLRTIASPAQINSTKDVSRVLDVAADMLERNPDPRMRGAVADAQTIRLAQTTGLDEANLLAAKSGRAFSDSEVVAANTLLENSLQRTLSVARDVQAGNANPDDFLSAMAKHAEIDDAVAKKVGSEAGRALRARQINAPAESDAGVISRPQALTRNAFEILSKLPEDVKRQAAAEFVKIPQDNTRALAKFIRDYTRFASGRTRAGRLADIAYEIRINSLLSGSAAVKKLASDTAMTILAPIERAMPVFYGEGTGPVKEAWHMARGFLTGIPDAMRAFSESWETELGSASEFEPRTFAIPGKTGRAARIPSRLVASVNDLVHSLERSGQIYAQAYRMASDEGLEGEALSQRVAKLAANPSDSMLKAANEAARERTFQKSLRSDKFGSWLRQGQNLPAMRWLVPFLKTPYNLFRLGVDFSMVGIPKSAYLVATQGFENASPTIMRAAIGSVATLWGAYLARQGRLSGIGPSDPRKRAALYATGWQPYSIKIGDHWFSYRYLQPLATSLMSVASFHDAGLYDRKPQNSLLTRLGHAMLQTGKSEFDLLPFMDQLAGLSSMMQGGQASASRIVRAARSEIGSLIPTGLTDFARMVDRTYRNPQSIKQELESRTPGLTKRVPPRVDISGLPEMRPKNALGGFNPFPVSRARGDKTLDELSRLGISFNLPKRATAPRTGLPAGAKAATTQLTPSESAAVATNENKQFYEQAQKLISDPRYAKLTDEQKRAALRRLRAQIGKSRYGQVRAKRAAQAGGIAQRFANQ